ncbi:MAG TPA: transposase [Methanosarcina sp.]|nr:transposase [Methanosarcina sp.]
MSINSSKCTDLDYINFLIAASTVFSCTEAARSYSSTTNAPSHDCFTRLIQKQPFDTEPLWTEVKKFVTLKEGYLIADDTVLDKPYSEKIGFVRHQWSGKHHRTVKGIGLITLVWTDGTVVLPIDFRIYNIEEDNKTKNDHFLDMLDKAEERGFKPKYVMFDTWYASIKNLKTIREKQWHFLTRLKSNRLVNPDNTKNIPLETVEIPHQGIKVHLKEYGFIKVFRLVPKEGDTQYWATDVLDMDESEREDLANKSWKIEEYHRGIKQFCGVEKCQARKKESQRAHIMFSLRAFLRLEVQRIRNGISWFESKMKIHRVAAKVYLSKPKYNLNLL